MKDRDRKIDILRFVAVFWVSGFTHLLSYTGMSAVTSYYPIFYISRVMLASLVFCSGMLTGRTSVSQVREACMFYSKRFFHTYLPLLISCAVCGVEKVVIGKWLFKNLSCFVLTLLGVSAVFTPAPSTLWFICMMLIFYAVTPLLTGKRTPPRFLFLSCAMYALLWILHGACSLVDSRVLMYGPIYFFGLAWTVFDLHKRLGSGRNVNIRRYPKNLRKALLFLGSVLVALLFILYGKDKKDNMLIQFVIAASGIPAVFLASGLLERIRGLNTVLAFLGSVSMSVYLFHRQVFALLQALFGETFSPGFAYGVALPVCAAVAIGMDRLMKRVLIPLERRFDQRVLKG